MKRKDISTILLLLVLIVTIVILSFKNDNRFNEERSLEVRRTERHDSLTNEQLNGLGIKINEIKVQMDSLREDQRYFNDVESQHYESLKQSLNQVKRMQKQQIKATK